MAQQLKTNHEIVSDKAKNPVTTSEYIKHGDEWLYEVVENAKNNYATPQMYGAVGDGETDDTQAFIEAFAANKNVFIPEGEYKISENISSPYGSLIGVSANSARIIFANNSHLQINGFGKHVANLTVTTNGDDFPVQAHYISDSTKIENIIINAPKNGMKISKSWYASVNNVRIKLTEKTGIGLQLVATSEGGVNNINFNGIFIHGGKHSVETVKESQYSNEQVGFYNCTFENCADTVIKTDGSTQGLLVDTAYMEGVASRSTTVSILNGSTTYGDVAILRNILVRTINRDVPAFRGYVRAEDVVSNTTQIRDCDDKLTTSLNNLNVVANGIVVKSEDPKIHPNVLNYFVAKSLLPESPEKDVFRLVMVGNTYADFDIYVRSYVDGWKYVNNKYHVNAMQAGGGRKCTITPDENNDFAYITISAEDSFESGNIYYKFKAKVTDARYYFGYNFVISGWSIPSGAKLEIL